MRRLLFPALAVGLGLVSALLILAVCELAVRLVKPQRPRGRDRVSTAVAPMRPAPTHLPIQLPTRLPHKGPGGFAAAEGRASRLVAPEGLYAADGDVGARPAAGYDADVKRLWTDDTVAYRAHYSIDEHRRRRTPNPGPPRPDSLLLLGCSFTFGEGVDDDQTIAAFAARAQPSFETFNHGIPGGGPGNVLRLSLRDDFTAGVHGRVKVVYLVIDHQLNRLIGTLDVHRVPGWTSTLPDYRLGAAGAVEWHGMISQRRLERVVFGALAKSELLKLANVQLPPRFTDEHFRLFAAVLAELRATLERRLPGSELYIAIHPGSPIGGALVPYLDERGLQSLDYSQVDLADYIDGRTELPDRHPTAATNAFLARQLVTDLRLMPAAGAARHD